MGNDLRPVKAISQTVEAMVRGGLVRDKTLVALWRADQARFVALTEEDCAVYNTSVTVDWEFAGHWGGALEHLYPRYASGGVVRGARRGGLLCLREREEELLPCIP